MKCFSKKTSIIFLIIFALGSFVLSNEYEFEIARNIESEIEDKLSDFLVIGKDLMYSFGNKNGVYSEPMEERYDSRALQEARKHDKKKMDTAMMMMMFQVGAASSWLMMTALLAAKSVAIGLLLLVVKIAFSSAKLASFLTSLKHHKHPDWSAPFGTAHDKTWPLADGPRIDRGGWYESPNVNSGPEWTPDDDY